MVAQMGRVNPGRLASVRETCTVLCRGRGGSRRSRGQCSQPLTQSRPAFLDICCVSWYFGLRMGERCAVWLGNWAAVPYNTRECRAVQNVAIM